MGLLKAINSYRKKLKKQIQNAHQEKPKPVNRERAPNTKKMQKESAVRASKQAQSHQTSSGASKGVKQQQRKNVENTAGGRAYAGAVSSVFTLGMAQPQSKKVRESKEYKAGRIAGDFLTYGTGYGAVGKALAKKTTKTVAKHAAENVVKETAKKGAEEAVKKTATKAALKTAESETRKALEKTIAKEGLENVAEKNVAKSLSENAAEKLAKTKVVKASAKRELAKKGIKDASEAQIKREAVTKADKLVSKVAQNVITDATVGTALDTAHAKGEGIKIGSKDYAKYMAQNAAMNVGFGVGAEAIGAGAKALKNNNKVLALVKQADGSWKKKLVEKDKYHFVDTPKQGKVAIEKHADSTFKEASNKRKAMREGNKEFKEAHGDMMRGKGSDERNFESLAMRRKLQTSNQDVLKAPELTPNRAWRDTKANYEKMGVKPPKSKGEASIEKLQELVEQPTERPKKYNQKAQRLVQDGEVAPKVQKKALDRFMADRDFEPVRAEKQLKNSEAVQSVEAPKSEDSTLKEVLNDEGFVKHIKNDNVNIQKYAEDNNMSLPEATKKLHAEYTTSKNLRTEDGIQKAMFGDNAKEIVRESVTPAKLINARTVPTKEPVKKKLKDMVDHFMYNWVDTSHEIEKFAKKADDEMISPLLDRVRNSVTASQNMVAGDRQVLLLKNGAVDNGKSVKGIFEPIFEKGEQHYKDLQEYMYHRMNETYRFDADKGVFGKNYTAEQSKKRADELLRRNPDFKQEADEIYRYLDGLRKMDVDAGMMSEQTAKTLKEQNPYYIPSYREKYFEKMEGDKGSRVGSQTIRIAKGDDSPLIPLHEQLAFETQRRMQEAALNDFGYRLMTDMGDDAVLSVRSINGVNPEGVAPERIFDPTKEISPNAIRDEQNGYVFNVRNGDDIYEVAVDKKMFDAIKAINQAAKIKIAPLVKANSIFRELVTTDNPLFAVRNGFRDFLDAPSFSQYGARHFYKNYAAAIKNIATNSDAYRTYKSLGGTGEGFFDIQKQFDNGTWFGRNIKGRIEALNEAVEQAPRFAEYLTTLEHEGNSKEGLLKALNNAHNITINFGRHGEMGQILNTNGVTFFNAGVQDIARLAKTFANAKSNPAALVRLFCSAATLGVGASAINELICGDMEGYKDLRTSEKDLNFLIPTSWIGGIDSDEKFIKIPKGRVTSVFAMPAQRAIREMRGNTREGENWNTGMLKDAAEQIAPMNPIENNLATPLYQALQKDGKTWYGAPIVPQALQDKKPSEQTDEVTTRLATKLGEMTGMSPKRIDYVLKQYSGVFGQVGQGLPVIGRPSMSDAEVSPRSVLRSGQNILKSNFVDDSTTNNGFSNNIYDRAQELAMYKDDSPEDKMAYDYMNEAKSAMSDFTKQIREIQGNEELTAEEKDQKVREVRREQIKLAKEYLGNEKKAKQEALKIAKRINKDDFNSDNTYKSALKEQLKVELNGAKSLVKEEDAKAKEKGKELLSKRLKKAGLTADEYYKELRAKNISLKDYQSAKNKGVSVDEYTTVKKAMRGSENYAGGIMKLIDAGYVKSFEDYETYDSGAKVTSWNTAVLAKQYGYSEKKLNKVLGKDTSSDRENRDAIKKYGTYGNNMQTTDALHTWIETEHKKASTEEKRLLWTYYGYKNQQRYNPY